MTEPLNLKFKLLTFFLINLLLSFWLVFSNEKIIPMLFFPISYGVCISFLFLDKKKWKFLKSLGLGLVFFIIFLISSFVMLAFSKKILGTDDYLPILSSPLSAIAIVYVINYIKKIPRKIILIITMAILGIIATYFANYFQPIDEPNILSVLVTIPFLWQMSTGIPLIISLEKQYTTQG